MNTYTLAFKPTLRGFGMFDPSAMIFKNGKPIFGIEEERLTRLKHAKNQFPHQSISACLDYCDLTISDLDRLLVPYDNKRLWDYLTCHSEKLLLEPSFFHSMSDKQRSSSWLGAISDVTGFLGTCFDASFDRLTEDLVKQRLEQYFEGPIPPIKSIEHHLCHAASAYFPASFKDGLIITVDGKGEFDSTVIWRTTNGSLSRERTYKSPNSLGLLYAVATEFLGYREVNGEGKVMGLAAYGSKNEAIQTSLYEQIDPGLDYDVTPLIDSNIQDSVQRLETLFGRPRKKDSSSFTDWEKDFAFTIQTFVEQTMVEIVQHYCKTFQTGNIGLAGGVALNCKMNKQIMELDEVNQYFVQPLAHDSGLALGAGLQHHDSDLDQNDVYFGPQYDNQDIKQLLEEKKVGYETPENLQKFTAQRLADGQFVGWFQEKMEMGPRALGNRSILADPRSIKSKDRLNHSVKHRESWRPFAPSIIEEAKENYLTNAERAPYMIKTFESTERAKEEIPAVLHPNDKTTRPQTVCRDQNPRYYSLLKEFENITGVPVLLNTSFNDHGEPIVMTPKQALKDFFGMGLDVLVLGDFVVRK